MELLFPDGGSNTRAMMPSAALLVAFSTCCRFWKMRSLLLIWLGIQARLSSASATCVALDSLKVTGVLVILSLAEKTMGLLIELNDLHASDPRVPARVMKFSERHLGFVASLPQSPWILRFSWITSTRMIDGISKPQPTNVLHILSIRIE